MINEGMQEIALASEWPWLEASTTVTMVDSQQNYDLPADFNFAIALVDNDTYEPLVYQGATEFFNRHATDATESTQSDVYTIWDDDIYLYPTPSTSDSDRLTLYYYKTVTTLDSGSDEPAFHTAFHPMLVEYCKWKLYDREEYFDQSERAFITFARYLSQMITWYERRAKRTPYIAGDGDSKSRIVDPNLRWVYQI